MKLSEFIALSEVEKRSTVLSEGVAIAKRYYNRQLVFLYQLHGFYVETYSCGVSEEICEYKVFVGTKQLQPYLDTIEIAHLINEEKG